MLIIYLVIFYLIVQLIYSRHHFKKARNISKIAYMESFRLYEKGKSKLNMLFAGDSIAAGVGASSFETSAAGRLVQHFSENHNLNFINKAKSGMEIKDLLNIRLPKAKQDIVVLIISSNDVFRFTSLREFSNSVKKVLDKYSKRTKKLIFLGPGKVSTAPALPLPIRLIYKIREASYASIIEEQIRKYANATYIKPGNPPKGAFAEDKFHPNDEGHKVGFEAIREVI